MTRSMRVARSNSAEHAEHLDHHPAGRSAGVERLRRASEMHSRLVELLQDLRQPADRAGEAVDPVDEEDVKAMKASVG